MNNEFRFKIKMLWEHRKKIINIKGIYAPNRKWADKEEDRIMAKGDT